MPFGYERPAHKTNAQKAKDAENKPAEPRTGNSVGNSGTAKITTRKQERREEREKEKEKDGG